MCDQDPRLNCPCGCDASYCPENDEPPNEPCCCCIYDPCDIAEESTELEICDLQFATKKLRMMKCQMKKWYMQRLQADSENRELKKLLQSYGINVDEPLEPDPLLVHYREENIKLHNIKEALEDNVKDLEESIVERDLCEEDPCQSVEYMRKKMKDLRDHFASQKKELKGKIAELTLKLARVEEYTSCAAMNRLRAKLQELMKDDRNADQQVSKVMEASVMELSKSCQYLEVENKRLLEEIEKMKEAMSASGAQPVVEKEEEEIRSVSLSGKGKERGKGDSYENLVRDLKDQLAEKEAQIKELQMQLCDEKHSKSELEFNLDKKSIGENALMAEINIMKEELKKKDEKINELMKNLRASTLSTLGINKLQEEIGILRSQVYDLQTERDHLLEELGKLRSTLSERDDQMKKIQDEKDLKLKDRLNEVIELQSEIDKLCSKNNDFLKEISDLKLAKENLETKVKECETLLKRIQNLEEEIVQLKSEIIELQNSVDSLQKELTTIKAEKEKLISENQQWEKKFNHLKNEKELEISHLTEEIENVKSERNASLKNVDDLKKANDTVTKKLRDSEQEKETMRKNLEELKKEKEFLSSKLSNLTNEQEMLKQMFNTTEEEKQNLQKALDNIKSEKEKLLTKLNETQKTNNDMTSKLNDLIMEKDLLASDVSKLKAEKDKLSTELAESKRTNDDLLSKLSKSNEEVKNLKNELENVNVEMKKLSADLLDTKKKNDEISVKMNDLLKEKDDVEKRLSSVKDENEKLKRELENSKNTEMKLLNELDSYKKENDQWTEKLKQLQAEKQNAEEKLSTAENENKKIKNGMDQTKKDLSDLKQVSNELMKTNEGELDLKEVNNQLKKELEEMKKQLSQPIESAKPKERKEVEVKDETSEKEMLKKQLESCKVERNKCNEELQDLNRKYQQLRETTRRTSESQSLLNAKTHRENEELMDTIHKLKSELQTCKIEKDKLMSKNKESGDADMNKRNAKVTKDVKFVTSAEPESVTDVSKLDECGDYVRANKILENQIDKQNKAVGRIRNYINYLKNKTVDKPTMAEKEDSNLSVSEWAKTDIQDVLMNIRNLAVNIFNTEQEIQQLDDIKLKEDHEAGKSEGPTDLDIASWLKSLTLTELADLHDKICFLTSDIVHEESETEIFEDTVFKHYDFLNKRISALQKQILEKEIEAKRKVQEVKHALAREHALLNRMSRKMRSEQKHNSTSRYGRDDLVCRARRCTAPCSNYGHF